MADSNYEELRRLAAEATPGPWKSMPLEADKTYIRIRGTRLGMRYKVANVHAEVFKGAPHSEQYESIANANFIASANPATILRLLAELDALRADAKDAARYRFLRDHAKAADMEYFGYQQAPGAFDAAIDEAMALHPGKDAGSGEGKK